MYNNKNNNTRYIIQLTFLNEKPHKPDSRAARGHEPNVTSGCDATSVIIRGCEVL